VPRFDVRCKNPKCLHQVEVSKGFDDQVVCELCGHETKTLMPGVTGIHGLGKQPYDYLDGPIPDSKKIKSFAHDRRKGGKDTT